MRSRGVLDVVGARRLEARAALESLVREDASDRAAHGQRTGIAECPHREVEAVPGVCLDDAATVDGLHVVLAPPRDVRVEHERADGERPADRAGVDRFLQHACRAHVAHVEADRKVPIRSSRGVRHRFRLCERARHRLLAEHVSTGRERVADDLAMRRRHRADAHEVIFGVRKQLAVARERVCAASPRGLPRAASGSRSQTATTSTPSICR